MKKQTSSKSNVIPFPIYRRINEEFLQRPPDGVGPNPVEYRTASIPLTRSDLKQLKADMKRAHALADKLLKLPKEPQDDQA